MMAWLRLLRLPTVFTALSNVLCGYFITQRPRVQQLPAEHDLFLLMGASAGLYLGGMVLNDVFDLKIDTIERPERPIPSGRITRTQAALAGGLLQAVGVLCAGLASPRSAVIAAIIVIAVAAYNAKLKSTPFGPPGMGLCRFLNLLLGASMVSLTQTPGPAAVLVASGLAVYIIGVTWFARNEASESSRGGLIGGLLILLTGLAIDAVVFSRSALTVPAMRGSCMALLLLGLNLTARATRVIMNPQPRLVQKTIGLMLLCLIFLDAITVFALTADGKLAAIVIALVAPAMLLRRVIPMS